MGIAGSCARAGSWSAHARIVGGRQDVERNSVRLSPQVRLLAWALERTPAGDIATMSTDDIARARKGFPDTAFTRLIAGRPTSGVVWADCRLPGDGAMLAVRVYRTVPAATGPAATAGRPLVLHLHGGGWVLGNATSAGWWCSEIAARLDAVVVSVEYRLAPEHRAPTAALDCFAVLRHLAASPGLLGTDPARTAVMGDSAGGNLAAVVALMARDAGDPAIAAQVLVYPATDVTMSSPSLQRLAHAPLLDLADIKATGRTTSGPVATTATRWSPRCSPRPTPGSRRPWSRPPSTTP
jgi:acetyl esterase